MIEISNIGLITAFAAGVVSFLSPCVLPLVPGYVSYVAGHSLSERAAGTLSIRLYTFALSTCFVLGFSTIFVLLGASATALGQALLTYRQELNVVGGAIVILFGLLTLGVLRFTWFQRDHRFYVRSSSGRPMAAYVLGLAFGPILGAILTLSATSKSVANGVVLLSIYSLGLGVPFLLAAVFTGSVVTRMRSIGRIGRVLKYLAGIVMVLMGIAMITGHLSTLSYWLLDTFPVFSTIG